MNPSFKIIKKNVSTDLNSTITVGECVTLFEGAFRPQGVVGEQHCQSDWASVLSSDRLRNCSSDLVLKKDT